MSMSSREFAEAIALMVASVGRSMSSDQSGAYFELLQDLTVDQLKQGIVGAIRQHKFAGFPPVGLIRECAAGPQALPPNDRAIAAWDAVRAEISRTGGYRSIEFDDVVINATIRALGGWVHLTDRTIDELVWIRKEFLETYRSLAASGVSGERTGPLPGIVDTENSRSGHAGEQPVPVSTGLPRHRPTIVRGDTRPGKPVPVSVAATRLAKRLTALLPVPEDHEQQVVAERERQERIADTDEHQRQRERQLAEMHARRAQ